MLPKMSEYVSCFDRPRYMSLVINVDQFLVKYKKSWKNSVVVLKKDLIANPGTMKTSKT